MGNDMVDSSFSGVRKSTVKSMTSVFISGDSSFVTRSMLTMRRGFGTTESVRWLARLMFGTSGTLTMCTFSFGFTAKRA